MIRRNKKECTFGCAPTVPTTKHRTALLSAFSSVRKRNEPPICEYHGCKSWTNKKEEDGSLYGAGSRRDILVVSHCCCCATRATLRISFFNRGGSLLVIFVLCRCCCCFAVGLFLRSGRTLHEVSSSLDKPAGHLGVR
jgi:hypothetical protein